MRYAIILAGGTGSRFWPLSSPLEPKQFLKVCSNKTMLGQTIERVSPLIKRNNIYLACGKIYGQKIKSCLIDFKIPGGNIFLEPQGRNTLAPIAFLSKRIHQTDPEAIIAVFPCDHFIKDCAGLLELLKEAMDAARDGRIITFGVVPRRPETGYGYIKVKMGIGHRAEGIGGRKQKIYDVERFTEKPDLAKAKRFRRDKRYYWNSGIFIFKAKTMLEETRRLAPEVYNILTKISGKNDVNRFWPKLPSLSMDYAIMEKTKNIALLPLDCGWVDLGSWQAIGEIIKKDKRGNVFKGNCIDMGSKNTVVWSEGPSLLATLGLEDIIVVNTNGALLVCAKSKAQEVKKIAQALGKKRAVKGIF